MLLSPKLLVQVVNTQLTLVLLLKFGSLELFNGKVVAFSFLSTSSLLQNNENR